jgi:hypothetical protein
VKSVNEYHKGYLYPLSITKYFLIHDFPPASAPSGDLNYSHAVKKPKQDYKRKKETSEAWKSVIM